MAPLPVAVVCIGMAGSGKTTFMQRINAHLHQQKQAPYVMNLDPAVRTVPFDCNIDIRDSIDYKEVMRQYNLGPNGGILTSLNLFATKVDQILDILEKRCGIKSQQIETTSSATSSSPSLSTSATATSSTSTTTATQTQSPSTPQQPIKHILIDTPGQIEVFVWSASGQILLSSLASTFPTVLAYVIDTPRTASTSTFMSNMLYACSILYKTKLPMILVFNKTDVQSAAFAKEWMTDFEAFQRALRREEETGVYGGAEGGVGGQAVGGSGYMSSLLNSMSLVLEEFYKHLSVVGVSSHTGDGVDEFFIAVEAKAQEFERDYKPELERRKVEMAKERTAKREHDLGRLMRDLDVQGGGAGTGKKPKRRPRPEPETISDLEDEDDSEDGDDSGEIAADLTEPDAEFEGDAEGNKIGDRSLKPLKPDDDRWAREQSGSDMSFARYIHKANMNQ